MKLLILGGTRFLGRALAQAGLERGHELTLFHRGRHDPEAFPEALHLIGDRDGGLEPLKGRSWDAVIDTSGYVPRVVRASAELLAAQVGHYTFISSISVYADLKRVGVTEEDAVSRLEDAASEDVKAHYGPLKALCEQAVEAVMPGRVLNVRPGLIVGPHDPTDRFTYWPHRLARGGEALVPLPLDRTLQVIDVRDLAAWIVQLVEARVTGTYHASGADYTMKQLIDACSAAAVGVTSCTWVPESFLVEQGVGEWIELPLWIRGDSLAGLFGADNAKARAAGLRTRPLADTVRDTLAWDRTRAADAPRKAGLSPERERELLAEWRRRQQA